MLKVVAEQANGRPLLIIGLSFNNLDRFRAEPGRTVIKIDGAATGRLPVDVMIISGETEMALGDIMIDAGLIGPDTRVTIDLKLKS